MRRRYIIFLIIIMCLFKEKNIVLGSIIPDGSGIRIGVIDTGVSELYDSLNKEQIIEGRNYVFPEQGTEDKIGHGTKVVSLIIGVKTDLGNVIGTAPKATIIPFVYQSRYPSGVTKNGGVELLAQAIKAAVDDYQCRVLCISSGIYIDEAILRDAVAYAEEKGVVVVAAVGNDNQKDPEKKYYPAAYDTVIGIGAVDDNNDIAEFSQRHGVFAVEKGKNITALTLDGTMKEFSGTSYANARAVGIVAALLSEVPDSSPEDIRTSLALSAKDLGDAGYDSVYGWGKINEDAALNILKGKKISDETKISSETLDTECFHKSLFIPAQKLLYKADNICFFYWFMGRFY